MILYVMGKGITSKELNAYRTMMIDGIPDTICGVTNNLVHCTTSNSQVVVFNGSYSTTITADSNYTLTGANVEIKMGGIDITSSAYTNGVIYIANVSGEIEINITAIPYVPPYTNLADPTSPDWVADARLNSTGSTTAATGQTVFNFISAVSGDVIRIKGIDDGTLGRVGLYNANKGVEAVNMAKSGGSDWTYSFSNSIATITITTTRTIAYFRYSGVMTGSSSEVVITRNEDI